jgi:di/tricarboxylate transporter
MNQSNRKTAVVCILLAIIIISGLLIISRLPAEFSAGTSPRGVGICIIVLLSAMVLFVTEAIPPAVTAILVPTVLSLPGIDVLSGKDAFKNFGEQWTVTFLGMFIIGSAILKTGFAARIGDFIVKHAKRGQRQILILLCITMGVVAAFITNAACMLLFAPIVAGIAYSAGAKPSQFFMPIAFCVNIGGNMTLMGAPSKGIVNGIMESYGVAPFNFFSYLPAGAIMFAAAIVYLALYGNKRMPVIDVQRVEPEQTNEARSKKAPFATAAFLFVVVTMSTGFLPPAVAAMSGVCIVIISGCISLKEAFGAVSWSTIWTFAGMLALGDALQKTGADKMIAGFLAKNIGSPVNAFYIDLLNLPADHGVYVQRRVGRCRAADRDQLGARHRASPLPYCMAVGIAVSLDFLMPFGSGSCIIAYEMGGYSYMDFVRKGTPLMLLCTLVGLITIPIFFPF